MPKDQEHYNTPSLDLDLSVRQEQRLTQQQRQALALLQQTRTELEQTIRKELDTNPALEEYYPDEDRSEDEIFSDEFSPDGQDAQARRERDGNSEFEDDDANSAQVRMLHQRIGRLGLVDRALVMMWLEGMSYDEIGTVMGITAKNVGVKLFRIKEQLKKLTVNNEQ